MRLRSGETLRSLLHTQNEPKGQGEASGNRARSQPAMHAPRLCTRGLGGANQGEARFGLIAQAIMSTASAILHDGNDEVGIKGAQAHGDSRSNQTLTTFRREDGGTAAFERFTDQYGKDPASIGTFEFGCGDVLLGDRFSGDDAAAGLPLAGWDQRGGVAFQRPWGWESNTGVDETQRGGGLYGLERCTCHHEKRTGKGDAMVPGNLGKWVGIGGICSGKVPISAWDLVGSDERV
jgi:hypothetical protein